MDARQTVEQLVAQADALYHDLDFAAVKAWRARTGGRVVGCLPTYSPKELIHAAGLLPVHLRGGGDQLEIIRGDAYFQSYICQMPRGIIELALSHRLDDFDGFVFPAICDVIRNLSGIWQLLFPDKLARYLDIPQNFDVEVGGAFYAEELGRLLADLEKLAGHPVTDEALRASIAAYNTNRRSVEALMTLRADKPWLVPADEAYLIIRAGDVLPVEEHTAMVDRYVALAAAAGPPGARPQPRGGVGRVLRAAAAGPHQDARARGLLHRVGRHDHPLSLHPRRREHRRRPEARASARVHRARGGVGLGVLVPR
jgi:benzoyl-CoA reductase subunit C